MILDPFNAALHTLRALRDATTPSALARSRRSLTILATHAERVIELLQKVDHAHADDRISKEISLYLDRMEECLLSLTKLLRRLSNGSLLQGLIWRDEIKSRVDVVYTTLGDAIDKLDPAVKVQFGELFEAESKQARRDDAAMFIHLMQTRIRSDEDAVQFFEIGREQMADAVLTMQKRVSYLADERVKSAMGQAVRGCCTVLGTPFTLAEPNRFSLSALELLVREDEALGNRGRAYVADWLDTPVAIRLQPKEFPTQLLLQVAEQWKALQHPNILPFIGTGTLSNPPFIVHAYASNGPILLYMERTPEANVLQLALDIASGLAYLHSKNLTHGDMRAANVLVSGQGKAILADFGLSPLKAADPSLRDNTKRGPDGRIRPRPTRWMSPEVMRGEDWSMSADVYGLGMTLYEIFAGPPLTEVLRSDLFSLVHRGERPTRPDSGLLNTMYPLWQLLGSCWAHQPQERPTSASVKTMLAAFIEDEQAQACGRQELARDLPGTAPSLPSYRSSGEIPPASQKSEKALPIPSEIHFKPSWNGAIPANQPSKDVKSFHDVTPTNGKSTSTKPTNTVSYHAYLPPPRNPSPPPPVPFRGRNASPVSTSSSPSTENSSLPSHLVRLASRNMANGQLTPRGHDLNMPSSSRSSLLEPPRLLRAAVSQPHLREDSDSGYQSATPSRRPLPQRPPPTQHTRETSDTGRSSWSAQPQQRPHSQQNFISAPPLAAAQPAPKKGFMSRIRQRISKEDRPISSSNSVEDLSTTYRSSLPPQGRLPNNTSSPQFLDTDPPWVSTRTSSVQSEPSGRHTSRVH